MTIGLYDQDLINLGFCAPNLNLMKLATYYKKNRDMVSMAMTSDPSPYSIFYYSQDYEGDTNYTCLNNVKTQFGGIQFNNEIWLPATIENCAPDTSIYARAYGNVAGEDGKIAERLLNIEHARLSLDGQTVWPNWKCQLKDFGINQCIMFHDTNLAAIANSYSEITSTLNYRENGADTSIATKYPIQLASTNELKQWSTLRCATHLFLLQINYLMSDTDIKILSHTNRTAYYNITQFLLDRNIFLISGLPQIIKVVKKFSNTHNQFLLIYSAIDKTIPLASKIINILNDFLCRGRGIYSLKQFIYSEYNADARLIMAYLKDQSPASYSIIKEEK